MTDDQPAGAMSVDGTSQRLYYVFRIGDAEYALGAHQVIEVRSAEPVIPMGNAPAFMTGVIPLGGVLVPIVDMRSLLGSLPALEPGISPSLVVVNIHGGTIGLVVDEVSGVTSLQPDQTQPLGKFLPGDDLVPSTPKKPRKRKAAAPVLH